MLRLVHLASGREWRGGERQVLLLARGLASDPNLEQVVITSRGSELERELRAASIPVEAVSWRIGLDPRAVFATLRINRGRRTILHGHDSHAVTIGALASAWSRTPLIATRRVDFPVRRPWPWRQARRVIAVSHAVKQVAVASGLDPARVQVVHSGIDATVRPATSRSEVRRSLGLSEQDRLAVNVAALVGHKDHRSLISAAARLRRQLPGLHWAIAGKGPLREAILRDVAAAELSERVHLLGQIPDPRSLIAAADVFVLSSRQEGLGTSVLDAMALGIPVVATRAGGIPELLDGGAGFLCPIEDPEALAGGVERVLSTAEEADHIAAKAEQKARQFSYQRMAREHASVYRSVDSDA